jgi:predicted GIY-YIG superfamily endonuclease
MSRTGFVYKLYCDGIDSFYIGSTWDMKRRKCEHKSNCNNTNSEKYNCKLYKYIRENKGFDNWKIEILVEKEFENKRELEIKEQECINLLKPLLNSKTAYQTEEERKIYNKAISAKAFASKIDCACGSKTNKSDKSRHEKRKKHQKYLQTINNITYNITTLNINK